MSTAMSAPPGVHTLLPGQAPKGEPILAVLLKRTYRIVPGARCVRAKKDRPLLGGDKHYGDPMNTTVRFESDFIPFKLATDVVLDGFAYVPGGKTAQSLTASLQVAAHRKDVRIIGDRICHDRAPGVPAFTDPKPFNKMELRYERAYGGVDVYTNPICQYVYPRNHLGKGFAVGNNKASVEALQLPNLEDPKDLLTPERLCVGKIENWLEQPRPSGFGWYSRYWQPRVGWAGILPGDKQHEQTMRAAYAQLLQPPFRAIYEENTLPVVDFRFFNGASPGLSVPYLAGDETVRLIYLTPDGNMTFRLPGESPAITLDIGNGPKAEKVVLHTVQIRAEDCELDLVWRAAFGYPGLDWLPEMKKTEVTIEG
jgi:hypothetical protein